MVYSPFVVMDAEMLHGVFVKIGCQIIILLIIVGSLLVKSTQLVIGCIYPRHPKIRSNAMAKIIIEIEDLPNGGVRYEPHGDLLILDDGTPAQLTWVALQDVIYMLEKIGAMQVK